MNSMNIVVIPPTTTWSITVDGSQMLCQFDSEETATLLADELRNSTSLTLWQTLASYFSVCSVLEGGHVFTTQEVEAALAANRPPRTHV